MLLVVDANIVFSALVKGGKTLDLFLLNKRVKTFEFVAPEYFLVEVEKHVNEIAEKTKLSVDELEKLFGLLEKAEQVSPDLDDVQYSALALKLSSAIWSNDKALKQQAVVKVFSTEELLNYVK